MAFEVGVNSGTTVVYLTDYLATRLIECCNDDDLIKQANLVKATDFITAEYSDKLIGSKEVDTQKLLFPRLDSDGAIIDDSNYQDAICLLAIESFNLDDEKLRVNADKRIISEQLDVIETTYDSYSLDVTKYSDVEALMKIYLLDTSSSYSYDIVR